MAAGSPGAGPTYTIPAKDYESFMGKAKKVLQEKTLKAMNRFGAWFIGEFIKRRLTKKGVQPPGGGLAVRRGAAGGMITSWDQRTAIEGDSVKNVIWSTHPGARIHEYGGDIVPVKAKYLTIPLEAAMTPVGIQKMGIRQFEHTFFHESENGKLFLMQQPASPGGDPIPLFLLVTKVHIPPRMGLREEMKRETKTRNDLLKKAVTAAMNELGRP